MFHAHILLAEINAGSTSGTTAQIITLDNIEPGDIVLPHAARIDTRVKLAGAGATITAQLGITGTAGRFIEAADLKAANADTALPVAIGALAPYVNNTAAAIAMILTVTAAGSTMSAITAGELLVSIPIIRKRDRLTNRQT